MNCFEVIEELLRHQNLTYQDLLDWKCIQVNLSVFALWHLKIQRGREAEHFNGNLQVSRRKDKPSIQPFHNSGEIKIGARAHQN